MPRTPWQNWSGSLSFVPSRILVPESEDELCDAVRSAAKQGKKVRVAGAGHSSTPLVETADTLISLDHFKGVHSVDAKAHEATVLAGMTVKEAGADLYRHGLAMHNTGDVDVQTLAGAIGTGTHGTGRALRNLSSMLVGARLVTGTGEIVEVHEQNEPDLLRALRVSLGTFGVLLEMRLGLEPAFDLRRMEWWLPLKETLERLNELADGNRNFDFYWYPRNDLTKIRIMNEVGREMPEVPNGRLALDERGPAHQILPRERDLKFDEMEYHLEASRAVPCFLEIRERIMERWRRDVAWRALIRTVKEDDAMLSPANGRATVTISVHHNAGMPFRDYFEAIEPLLVRHGGRPHWGKKHSQTASALRPHFDEWEQFQAHRGRFDPEGVFMTPYVQRLLLGE